jgi:branched-chain amino acid aminotransferase
MSIRVHINGRITLPEEARVSVLDRGFLYGDSVYETIGTVAGRLYALGEHLDRLARSAERIGLSPPPRQQIEQAIVETLAAAGNLESRVRVMLTRGVGALDLDPASATSPQLIVIVAPLGGPTADMYERGVGVHIVSVSRNDPRAIDPAVKSGNYLNNVLALREARRLSGAHEAILRSGSGSLAEGASSNIFLISAGTVRTPALSVGILDGITRATVLELCKADGIPVLEVGHLAPDELRRADEAFITSAARGVLPVTIVDGVPLGAGIPGPLTRRLRALYRERVQQVLAASPTGDPP